MAISLTFGEKKQEWLNWYRASPDGYQLNALLAVLENDGEKMLAEVLSDLGLESTLGFVREAKKKGA